MPGVDQHSPESDRTDRLIAAALGIFSLALFLLSLDFRTSGDSLVYADNISKRHFDFVAVHYGYYVLAWVLHVVVRPVWSVPIDFFIVYLNAFFGAAGVVVSFWLARKLLGSTRIALYTSLILTFSGRYFLNATSAEMYAPQSFFLFGSFYLFLVGRAVTSAFSAFVALLISPLSLFSFLFYPIVTWQRRLSFRHLVIWSVAVGLTYGLFLAVYYQALFWGERGLFAVTDVIPFEYVDGLRFFASDLVRFFGPAVLFFVLAAPTLKRNRLFFLLVAGVYVPHVYVMFKQARADQLLAPTDFFFAAVCALGLNWLDSMRLTRYLTVPLLVASLGLSAYLDSAFGGADSKKYSESMRAMYEQVMKDSNRVVIMKWFDRISAQYYNTGEDRVWDQNPVAPHIYDEQWFDRRPPRPLPAGAEFFVLEDYSPSRISRLLRSEQELRERHEEVSLRRRVERDFKMTCQPAPVGSLELYRCSNAANP